MSIAAKCEEVLDAVTANAASERVKRLRERFMNYRPNVDPERAVIYDRVFMKSDELAGEPMIVARAKAFYTFLNERTIYIEDDQLFAGSFGRRPRAFPVYPESVGDDLVPEYRKLTTREIDPFEYDDETRETLEELLPRWHDASLRQKVFPSMSPEEKNLFLMDPEHNIVKGTNIFTLDVPLYGPAGHITPDWQSMLEFGFQGVKRRAEKRLEQARAEKDQRGVDFLRAAIISCDAITNFAGRYADLAAKKAAAEADPARKAELERLAEACRRVPGLPPHVLRGAAGRLVRICRHTDGGLPAVLQRWASRSVRVAVPQGRPRGREDDGGGGAGTSRLPVDEVPRDELHQLGVLLLHRVWLPLAAADNRRRTDAGRR